MVTKATRDMRQRLPETAKMASAEPFITSRGFSGKILQEIMNKWATKIGIEPMKLARKEDLTFIEKFNEICSLTGRENTDQPINFCPTCGNPISFYITVCGECGTKLKESL